MKKIFGVCVVLCFGFIGYSHGLYSDQCSGGKVYRAEGVCGSCSSCNGIMYGGTSIIGCDVVGYRQCCETPGVLYKNDTKCCQGTVYQNSRGVEKCCGAGRVVVGNECKSCESLTETDVSNYPNAVSSCNQQCDPGHEYPLANGLIACCEGSVDSGVCYPSLSHYGINLDTECLMNGQCSLNVYKVMGIRQQDPNPTVLGFFQDITLASTTAILGTVLTVALVIAGLYLAIGSISGSDTKKARTIIMACFTGLLLIMGSYAIIRLIQFLALAGT